MTYGSVFTGIGGIDLGLDRAGWECRWQVEIDPYAVKVLEKHWPDVKRYGDITKLTGEELDPVDAICGGFPCQDLSQAGKQAGIEGTRSGLWFEYARLIRQLRPRYVLIENVPGLLIHDAMRRVIGELARLGYVGCWRSLRASEFGASHLRKRVFIVAYSSEGAGTRIDARAWNGRQDPGGRSGDLAYASAARQARPQDAGTDIGDARENGSGRIQPERSSGHVAHAGYAGKRRPAEPAGFDECGPSDHDCGTSRTLEFAPGPSDPRWPSILRERPDLAPALPPLRGMADGLSDWMDRAMKDRTKRLGRLGNAVVPQIAEWIGQRILEFEKHQWQT